MLQCIAMGGVGSEDNPGLKSLPNCTDWEDIRVGETRRNMFSSDFKLSSISMLPLEKHSYNSVLCRFLLREFLVSDMEGAYVILENLTYAATWTDTKLF